MIRHHGGGVQVEEPDLDKGLWDMDYGDFAAKLMFQGSLADTGFCKEGLEGSDGVMEFSQSLCTV